MDTYIGFYRNEGYRIDFDFGFLSFGNIDEISNTPNLLYYEELLIDGAESKIIKEDRSDGIRLSVYIDKGDGMTKNRMYTFNTSNDQLFMDIVKSHRFK